MTVEKEKFRDYDEESQTDQEKVISVKFNEEEQIMLRDAMIRLRQPKKGTAIKELLRVGYGKVVQEQEMINSVLDNYRKNSDRGLANIKKEIMEKW